MMSDEQILDAISLARMQNNKNWMSVLALALKVAPEDTKKLLARIRTQDMKIGELLAQLSRNADSQP